VLKHFTGTHDHRMDDKGRVSLPTEFRRVLDAMGAPGSLYVVPGVDDPRGLAFLTTTGYDELIDRHNKTPYPDKAARRRAEIRYITRATQVQVDDAGRIVVAKSLREKFGLGKEVRFVGLGSHFELWQPDLRDAVEEEEMATEAAELVEIDLRGLHG
jgi:MraZ protein